MIHSDPVLLGGVVLALAGAASVLIDAIQSGGNPRFIAYLIGLLLSLAGIGLVLAATL